MNRQLFFVVVVQGKNLKVPISDGRTVAVFGYIRSFVVAKSNGLKDDRLIPHDEPRWIIFNGKDLSIDAKSRSIVVFDGLLDRVTIVTKDGEVEKVFDVDEYGVMIMRKKDDVIKEYMVDEKGRLRKIENKLD